MASNPTSLQGKTALVTGGSRGIGRAAALALAKAGAPSFITYAAACKAINVPCNFTKTEHVGHGFGLKPGLPPDVKDWPEKLHAFLNHPG